MTIELTREETEILIAVLVFAEDTALEANHPLVEAMKVLRPWRSRLMQAYICDRLAK